MPSKTLPPGDEPAAAPLARPRRRAGARAAPSTPPAAVAAAEPASRAHAADASIQAPARKAARKTAKAPAKAPVKAPAKAPAKTQAKAPAKARAKAPAKALAEAAAKAAPRTARKTASKARAPAAAGPGAVVGDASAPPPPALPLLPAAVIEAPADGSLFGRYGVLVAGEEPAEVELRGNAAGAALCTCLDFALSEDGSCAHLDALRGWLQGEPARAAAWAQGPAQPGSRIGVRPGARRRLLWLPGRECPAEFDERATQVLGAEPGLPDAEALRALLERAVRAGHEVQVEDAAWEQLAAARDAAWRVERLQAQLPQGPASDALHDLMPGGAPPLLPVQLEGALFAVCAGRCVLADDPVLQPLQQALAASQIWRRLFGVERVLLLAPGDELDRWRRLLPADAAGWSLTAIDNVAADVALHRSLAPELVIVHEPAAGGLWVDAERAAALLRLDAPHAIVLPAADWLSHPAELPLRLAFVDVQRLGAYEALLRAHGVRDEAGQLCGLDHLGRLHRTLESVLLMRSRDEVVQQLPERVERVLRVGMPAAEQMRHDALAAELAARLRHAQSIGWLPDREQRRLLGQVQALRRLCAGEAAPGLARAKAEALSAVAGEQRAEFPRLAVFSQWPAALDAQQSLLAEAGVACVRWRLGDADGVRREAAERWRSDADVRVLLADDRGGDAQDLPCADAQVVHLDRPWHPRQLDRRFARVHAPGQARLVPVVHLLAEAGFEARLAALPADRAAAVTDLLDAGATAGFMQGDEVQRWLDDLLQVLALPRAGH